MEAVAVIDKQAQVVIMREELERLKATIAANISNEGAYASGRTTRSLEVTTDEYEATLWGRSPFGTLETGRKPGRVPGNFQSIILQWMRDKGVSGTPIPYKRQPSEKWQPKYTPQQRGDMTLAWFISEKIRKQGTRLYRQGGRDTIYSQAIKDTLQRIEERIFSMVEVNVMESIKINEPTNIGG